MEFGNGRWMCRLERVVRNRDIEIGTVVGCSSEI
jgi:hypothetical protein